MATKLRVYSGKSPRPLTQQDSYTALIRVLLSAIHALRTFFVLCCDGTGRGGPEIALHGWVAARIKWNHKVMPSMFQALSIALKNRMLSQGREPSSCTGSPDHVTHPLLQLLSNKKGSARGLDVNKGSAAI